VPEQQAEVVDETIAEEEPAQQVEIDETIEEEVPEQQAEVVDETIAEEESAQQVEIDETIEEEVPELQAESVEADQQEQPAMQVEAAETVQVAEPYQQMEVVETAQAEAPDQQMDVVETVQAEAPIQQEEIAKPVQAKAAPPAQKTKPAPQKKPAAKKVPAAEKAVAVKEPPAAKAPASKKKTPAKQAKAGAAKQGAADKEQTMDQLPVLVVDSDSKSRRTFKEILSAWKMKPTAVNGGQAALAALRRASDTDMPYAMILIDVETQEVGNYNLIEMIQQTPKIAGARIIVITDKNSPMDEKRLKELKISACLTKPVSPSSLLETIQSVLGIKAASPERGAKQAFNLADTVTRLKTFKPTFNVNEEEEEQPPDPTLP